MKFRSALAFLLIFFCSYSSAQEDLAYVERIPDTKVFGLFTQVRNFKIAFNSGEFQPVVFQAFNQTVGIRFKFKRLSGSISLPVKTYHDVLNSNPRSLTLGFGLFPRSFFITGEVRTINGLNDLNNAIDGSINFRDDINVFYLNLFGAYLFNGDRLSLRSAMNMVNRQRKSEGSFVVSSILEFQNLGTESILFPSDSDFDLLINRYRTFKLGSGIGYAYSLVVKDLAITGLVSGGPEFRYLDYNGVDPVQNTTRLLVSPRARIFGSIVFNQPRFFIGFTGSYLPGYDVSEQLNTRITNWTTRLTIGYRYF